MSKLPKIPRIPHAFFKWYCRKERYEELHGDLEEFYWERVEEIGVTKARLFYLWDVICCCQPYAWKKPKRQTNSNVAMFKNFYFTAIRNQLKSKSHSLINISGLTIGIASFAFIILYIVNEMSYDRFHSNYQNIYRISNHAAINGELNYQATTNSPITKKLLDEYPEVIKATRIIKSNSLLIGRGSHKIHEEGILFADSTFFEVFDFILIKGNPETALVEPRSMILSKSYATKYFGDEDPVGQQITVENDTTLYMITGVVEDVPANSHIQFDMLGSMSTNKAWNTDNWIGVGVHAYVVLSDGADTEVLEEKMQDIFYEHVAPEIEYYTGQSINQWEKAGNSSRFKLVPLTDIHLHSVYFGEMEPTGNISYIYIYAAIGLIILFIAIFNYINLATAQATSRSREVGIRKVMGSTKAGLVFQFILESVIISIFAGILAVILVTFLMPSFIDLIDKELAFGLSTNYFGSLFLLCIAILVGVMAGAYPAFILADYKPVQALKGGASVSGKGSGWLRNFLVIIQFTASIIIIISTVVVYYQINFMMTKNLGFDREQILVISRPDALKTNLETFENDLLLNPNINAVVNSKTIPGKSYVIRSYRPKENPETFLFLSNLVGFNYQKVMGLELLSGRFFSKEFRSDSNAVVINEAAARAFGFENPIGQNLISPWHMGEFLTIIGVVKDYNVESLHKKIEPVALELIPDNSEGYISVKLSNDQNIRETIKYIEDIWHKYSQDQPFQYFFFNEDYDKLYKSENATGKLFIVFAVLSIFIACLGLIGLISYNLSVRKKEIGIRKVLGASTKTLAWLLSSQVVRLVIIATLVGWPLAYFATDYWLQNFAERIDINPWIYIGSTLVVVLIGSLSISFQTIKASSKNPVDSLRQE